MKYEELYREFLKAHEWDFSDGVRRFLEWCEREGIEIGRNENENKLG